MLQYFRLAVRNIRYRKKRSWLTIIGTLVGILAIVALISIGQGLQNSVQSQFQELGGDKVFISPGGNSISSRFTSSTAKLTEDDIAAVRSTRGVEEASGIISSTQQVSYGNQRKFLTILGAPTGENAELIKETQGLELVEGRYLKDTDRYSVVVSESAVESAFEDEIVLRSSLGINGTEYRVVGIVEAAGRGASIYMQMEAARELMNKEDEYDQIVARISQGFSPKEVERNIRDRLRQLRNVEKGEEDFTTRTAADIIDSFTSQLALIRGFLVGLGAISLLVGGVGIMNTMYTSVTERTQEIGVMKAVGATDWQILRIFLIESGIIGLVGGVLGTALGLGISYAASGIISQQVGIQMQPGTSPELVFGSLAFAFVVGTVSGFFPARKAAKMNPVEALRYEK
ncbi:MAG: ABC transporter permease [Candidatus Nanohaloarchaea archaeon]